MSIKIILKATAVDEFGNKQEIEVGPITSSYLSVNKTTREVKGSVGDLDFSFTEKGDFEAMPDYSFSRRTHMESVYYVGVSNLTRPTITIRRKPSEIPEQIDRALSRMDVCVHNDGSGTVVYEFFVPGSIQKAEAYLQRYGWREKKESR